MTENILPECIEYEWSASLSKSLFESFGTETTKGDLMVAIL